MLEYSRTYDGRQYTYNSLIWFRIWLSNREVNVNLKGYASKSLFTLIHISPKSLTLDLFWSWFSSMTLSMIICSRLYIYADETFICLCLHRKSYKYNLAADLKKNKLQFVVNWGKLWLFYLPLAWMMLTPSKMAHDSFLA